MILKIYRRVVLQQCKTFCSLNFVQRMMVNRKGEKSCTNPGLCFFQAFIFVIGVLCYEARIFSLLSDMMGYTIYYSVLDSKTWCLSCLPSMLFPCEESYREEKPENSIFYILERSISDGGEEKLSESKNYYLKNGKML